MTEYDLAVRAAVLGEIASPPVVLYRGALVTWQQGRERGARFYFTGKPCPKGYIEQRYVSSRNCLHCHRDRTAPAARV